MPRTYSDDELLYTHNGVLRNNLGLTDNAELELAERAITTRNQNRIRAMTIDEFDLEKLCFVHKELFRSIYPWAGELRKVELSKGGTKFCPALVVAQGCDQVFIKLGWDKNLKGLSKEEFCKGAAQLFNNLNDLHPFREGNGRTIRLVLFHVAKNAGWFLDLSQANREEYMAASIAGCQGKHNLMEELMLKLIQPWPSGRGTRKVALTRELSLENEKEKAKEMEKPLAPIQIAPRRRVGRGIEF